ncbi:hypothetical protein BS78_10G170600 [Paspalum vaginatum]|nr:hypothetical protein BS78_10G170600 [Paspalum vaginatum]
MEVTKTTSHGSHSRLFSFSTLLQHEHRRAEAKAGASGHRGRREKNTTCMSVCLRMNACNSFHFVGLPCMQLFPPRRMHAGGRLRTRRTRARRCCVVACTSRRKRAERSWRAPIGYGRHDRVGLNQTRTTGVGCLLQPTNADRNIGKKKWHTTRICTLVLVVQFLLKGCLDTHPTNF